MDSAPCHPGRLVYCKITGWVALVLFILPGLVWAEPPKLTRLRSRDAVIEERIAAGRDLAWVLKRDSLSFRGQTRIDGILVAEPESPLRLKAIRRRDGDHEFLLGEEGKPGESIADLQDQITDIHRMHLVPHQLVKGEMPLAVLYVPQGAWLRAFARNEAILVDLELPWEPGRFREDFVHRRHKSNY